MKKGQRRYKSWKRSGFPLWLQDRMAERNWNAYRLSQEVGVVPSLVSRWMSARQLPSTESCKAIAAALLLSEQEVMRAAGYLSAEEEDAPADHDPRFLELLEKLRYLVTQEALTHERYEFLAVLLNDWVAKAPPRHSRTREGEVSASDDGNAAMPADARVLLIH